MADTSDFRNGLIINHKNSLWKIIEFLHVKPGKGPAFVRTKLKNIKTGQVVDETFRAGGKIVEVRIEAKNYNYLYDYFYQRYKRLERGDYTLEQYTEDIKEGGYYGPWGFRLLEKTAMERDYGLLGKLQVKLEEYRILNGGR